ncbi:uncharacterized protein TEOVI_000764600 [Trypanosoma equiperdum]|uniref:Uncharacterized protein n=1 Tax=Trypanosoma equiperdum TaxID=5694 RepID=A0A1G4HZX1_TRYEQ|nr:hypothetical protein, conserved [Trypanosoma equiperdum]
MRLLLVLLLVFREEQRAALATIRQFSITSHRSHSAIFLFSFSILLANEYIVDREHQWRDQRARLVRQEGSSGLRRHHSELQIMYSPSEEAGASPGNGQDERLTSQPFETSRVPSMTPRSLWANSSRSDASAKQLGKSGQSLRYPSPPHVPPDGQLGAEEEVEHEKYVLQLLQRASRTIKDERAHSLSLKKELDELKQLGVTPGGVEKLQKENRSLKDRLTFLCGGLSQGNLFSVPGQHLEGGKHYRWRRDQRPLKHTPVSARVDNTTPVRTLFGVSPMRRDFARGGTESCSGTWRSASSCHTSRRVSARGRCGLRRRLSVGSTGALTALWAAAPLETRAVKYTVGMIAHLRRAMAPLPAKEQIGEVIHAMVQEILREARQRGTGLKMKRQKPCVYECTYSPKRERKIGCTVTRVVHLSIDSGRLTVKVGGGHVNFLDFLERYCNCRFAR